jgi:uncharacterized protein YcaQ
MTIQNISLKITRRLILHSQLLDDKSHPPLGKEGAAQVIERLGYVQIDTISRVERAHHHTIWTRVPDYQPAMIDELQVKEQRIFEYWGHEASYLPMRDYRFYLPRMRSFEDPHIGWHRNLLEEYNHLTPQILDRIRQEGPLSSKDFKHPSDTKQGGWWNWKPAKTALELLFWQGKLMVAERRGFQRVYDLTERVLPAGVDTRYPDEEELGQFYVRRALQSMAVAREREILKHLGGATQPLISKSLHDLLDKGEVVELELEGDHNKPYYALTSVLGFKNQKDKPQIHILSPFDNLIIQRDRTRRLFDFEFTIQCYLPAEKREIGYFLLPILWGDRFIARMDVQADRKNSLLIIHNLVFEPEFHDFDQFIEPFIKKCIAYTKFNGCSQISINKTSQAKIKTSLKRLPVQFNITADLKSLKSGFGIINVI